MRLVLNTAENIPHPEERPKSASRRTYNGRLRRNRDNAGNWLRWTGPARGG
jgi:hypothetical protein